MFASNNFHMALRLDLTASTPDLVFNLPEFTSIKYIKYLDNQPCEGSEFLSHIICHSLATG